MHSKKTFSSAQIKKGTKQVSKSVRSRVRLSAKFLFGILLFLLLIGFLIWYFYKPSLPKPIAPEEEAIRETQAQDNLVFGGIPKPINSKISPKLLRNKGYYVGYSEERKNPLWVAYRLDRVTSFERHKRPKKFLTDTRTQARVAPKDYTSSGFDRGHLAPNFGIAIRFGPEAQLETFLMSNICPQKPDLNRKVWEKLERLESDYANRFIQIWVITGPIFDDHKTFIGNNVEIPDAFYKILVDEDDRKFRFLPFIIPQDVKGNEHLALFLKSIDEIEKNSEFDFFWALSDEFENSVEAYTPSQLW